MQTTSFLFHWFNYVFSAHTFIYTAQWYLLLYNFWIYNTNLTRPLNLIPVYRVLLDILNPALELNHSARYTTWAHSCVPCKLHHSIELYATAHKQMAIQLDTFSIQSFWIHYYIQCRYPYHWLCSTADSGVKISLYKCHWLLTWNFYQTS